MDKFIPLSIPNFEGNERKYVDDALDHIEIRFWYVNAALGEFRFDDAHAFFFDVCRFYVSVSVHTNISP